MGEGMDISQIPPRSVLGRNATPYDIARAVYFLVSGLSDYMIKDCARSTTVRDASVTVVDRAQIFDHYKLRVLF